MLLSRCVESLARMAKTIAMTEEAFELAFDEVLDSYFVRQVFMLHRRDIRSLPGVIWH